LHGEFGAQRFIGGGQIGEPVRKCAEVEAGSADDDRAASARGKIVEARARQRAEAGGVAGLGERHFADEMMRHAGEGGAVGLGRQEIEAAVDLEGIRADDLTVPALREIGRKVGLSHSGGTDQKKRRREG